MRWISILLVCCIIGCDQNFSPPDNDEDVYCYSSPPAIQQNGRNRLLDAICRVESNGNPRAIGDNGRSKGAYQISRAAWIDAKVPWDYDKDVWDAEKSRIVAEKYMERYAGKDGTDEKWARVFNGGPKGNNKPATIPYWKRVKAQMEQ